MSSCRVLVNPASCLHFSGCLADGARPANQQITEIRAYRTSYAEEVSHFQSEGEVPRYAGEKGVLPQFTWQVAGVEKTAASNATTDFSISTDVAHLAAPRILLQLVHWGKALTLHLCYDYNFHRRRRTRFNFWLKFDSCSYLVRHLLNYLVKYYVAYLP